MHRLGDRIGLEDLRAHAAAIVTAWGAMAEANTTVGQERAILRLFGVSGLDRSGRPLAAEVVDRYLAPDPRRLGGGIALPFAMAMVEYDLGVGELALEIAAGNVDLGLEADLLDRPERRALAEAQAVALARMATERIDANRVARRELVGLLGDPPRPWIGLAIESPAIVDALDEVEAAVDAGIELLSVAIPPSRELSERMTGLGGSVDAWRAAPSSRGGLDASDPHGAPVPTGSQRALSVLRRFMDEAGARRRGYVRLLTDAQALAAPDQAVVAAFERIDVVVADPMREIVTGRVDPDRALADHVFAHRLLDRAGTRILVPAGPLVVTADLAAGIPSDPATRSGRALALQLLTVALASRNGLAPDAVSVGALPDWIADEAAAPARAAAEVALRRELLPEHPLSFVEPATVSSGKVTWHSLVAALLADAGEVDMVLRRSRVPVDTLAAESIGAAAVAVGLRGSRSPGTLEGTALDHAMASVAAAEATLAALEDGGWRAFVDQPLGMPPALGAEAVASRRESFDPFAVAVANGEA